MRKAVLLTSVTALALAAPAAFAAIGSGAAAGTYPAAPSEIRDLQHARVSLPQAISAAERETHGKALYAFLDDRQGKPTYRVQLLEGKDRLGMAWVDAISARVTAEESTIAEKNWTPEERRQVAALRRDKLDLTSAIALAAKQEPGKPVDASLNDVDHTLGYQVDFIHDGRVEQTMMPPSNPIHMAAAR